MLLAFIVDYSRDPELRNKFQQDPAKVFAHYEISPADQKHLERNDREAVAARLHEELDQNLFPPITNYGWSLGYPAIVDDLQPSQGAVGESLSIAIPATDLAPSISVEFFNATDQVRAEVTSVDSPHTPSGHYTINCTATFRSKGTYSLTVTNLVASQSLPASRPDCFKAE